jgi:hypothetical protein
MTRRRKIAAAVALSAVAVAGAVAGIVAATGGGTPVTRAPRPALGQSLKPLPVYQRPRRLARTPRPDERAVPVLSGSGSVTTVVRKQPVITLHVDYARVIPYDGGWRITFDAQESDAFNERATFPDTFVVLVDGKATNLLFDAHDGVNYEIGGKGEFPTLPEALAVAKSLTSSVTIARCTQDQIEQYKCA